MMLAVSRRRPVRAALCLIVVLLLMACGDVPATPTAVPPAPVTPTAIASTAPAATATAAPPTVAAATATSVPPPRPTAGPTEPVRTPTTPTPGPTATPPNTFDLDAWFGGPGAQPTPVGLPTLVPMGNPPLAAPPAWARDAVLYQIFVRAFTPEGTIAAATRRLPDVKDLGANLIYLMPVQPSGKLKAKGSLGSPYSIRDYLAVDPAQGTEDDLKTFIATAHGLGMKVIMDFVADHTAWDNPLTTEHPDWYKRDAAGNILAPQADWTDVAALNYQAPELSKYMIDVALHYITADDLDGYRADAAELVPLTFWQEWRQALKAAKPAVLLLADSNTPQMHDQAFDALYGPDPRSSLDSVLSNASATFLLGRIVEEQNNYGLGFLRARFLENDAQDRWAATHQGEALRITTAFLLSMNGIPFLYAGQEIGATARPDLLEPSHVNWTAGDANLRAFFKAVLTLRRSNPALSHGLLQAVAADHRNVAAFLRRAPEQTVFAYFNFSDRPDTLHVQGRIVGRDLQTGQPVDLTTELRVAPYGWGWVTLSGP